MAMFSKLLDFAGLCVRYNYFDLHMWVKDVEFSEEQKIIYLE